MSAWVSVGGALGAAVCFAGAAVLQQEATQSAPRSESLHLGLIVHLLHQPKWLTGVVVLLAGFGLQALALAYGPVALVQPIIVLELAIAIPLAIFRRQRRASVRDWLGIVLVLGGVSAFLVAASPAAGIANPEPVVWIPTLTPVGAIIAFCVALGARANGPKRAMLLGASAGMAYGLLAVLTKAVTHQFSTDLAGAFASWQLYLVITFGIAALVISQSAYQAGPLAYSMPLVAVLEPLIAVVIGDTALNEQVQFGIGGLALEGLAAAVEVAGIILLSTSTTVHSVYVDEQRRPSS